MDGVSEGSRHDEPKGCLDEQAVLDFAAGLVPAQGLSDVERHLAGCDRCAELVMLAAALGDDQSRAPYTRTAAVGAHNAAALLQPDTALNDTYRIVRFVGEGGMGEVYEVRHSRLAGRYAAKVLSLELAKNAQAFSRFRREAQIASGLSHPNIVQVIDFSELDDGRPFLVMEFLDGQDLGQILSKGPLPLDRTMRLVEQIVSALAALHGHRIVHRDLKPQNIFVLPGKDGDSEHVKLVDFGLAKRASPSMAVTRERSLLGTPQYMAPEQAIGKAESLGPETDQFALAALVYEMLGGKPAFEGDVLSTVLYRIVHEMPAPLRQLAPSLPAPVYAALERGLAKAPEARFPSIKAFFNQLQLKGSGVDVDVDVDVDVGKRSSHRPAMHRRWLAATAMAMAVIGGAAFLRTWTRDPTPSPTAAHTESSKARGANDAKERQMTRTNPAATTRDGPTAGSGATGEKARPRVPSPAAGGQRTEGAPRPMRERMRPKQPPRSSTQGPAPPAPGPLAPAPPASRPPHGEGEGPLIETL